MSGFFNDQQKLEKHFLDAWDNSDYSDIPVDLIGRKNDPDNKGRVVRVRVKRAPSGPFSVGASRRNFGSVMVQIVGKTGVGAAEVLRIMDDVSEIFAPNNKPVRIDAIRCKTPSASGPHEEDTLVTAMVDIPFFSDYSG